MESTIVPDLHSLTSALVIVCCSSIKHTLIELDARLELTCCTMSARPCVLPSSAGMLARTAGELACAACIPGDILGPDADLRALIAN